MNDVSFRAATLADLPAIIGMLADDDLGRLREVVGDVPDPRYVAAFQAIEADPNQLLIVAVQGGAPVGTLQLTFIPGLVQTGAWRGQIEAVRVARSLRGQGIGKKMFDRAIDECRSRGCRFVQLTTDKTRVDAHRFYENLGFVSSHEGYKLVL